MNNIQKVTFNGKEYNIFTQPILWPTRNPHGYMQYVYTSYAFDHEPRPNAYAITWEPLEPIRGHFSAEELAGYESNKATACDWNNPSSVSAAAVYKLR